MQQQSPTHQSNFQITTTHLSYYSCQHLSSFTFYLFNNKFYLTLIDEHQMISFQLETNTNELVLPSDLHPFRTLQIRSIKKGTLLPKMQCYIDSYHNFVLQSRRDQTINTEPLQRKEIQGVIDYTIRGEFVVVICTNGNVYTIQMSSQRDKQDSSLRSNEIKFPKFCQSQSNWLLTQGYMVICQYILKFEQPRISQQTYLQISMVPNGTFDGTTNKRFLAIGNRSVCYQMGKGHYYVHHNQLQNLKKYEKDTHFQKSDLQQQVQKHNKQYISKIAIENRIRASQNIMLIERLCLLVTIEESYPQSKKNTTEHTQHSLNVYCTETGTKALSIPLRFNTPHFLKQDPTSSKICIIDLQSLEILTVPTNSLLLSQKSFSLQTQFKSQEDYHQNFIKTILLRKKHLLSFKTYLQKENGEPQSLLKMLENQQNCSLLNDGLRMLVNSMKQYGLSGNPMRQQVQRFEYRTLNLAKGLLASKYESHIQTALQILIKIAKKNLPITFQTTVNAEQKAIKNALKQIVQAKRVQKLLKQSKKKKLFELSYELTLKVQGRGNFMHTYDL